MDRATILASPKPVFPIASYRKRVEEIFSDVSLLASQSIELICPFISSKDAFGFHGMGDHKVTISPLITPYPPEIFYSIFNNSHGVFLNNRGGNGALQRAISCEIPIFYLEGDQKSQLNYLALDGLGMKMFTVSDFMRSLSDREISTHLIENKKKLFDIYCESRRYLLNLFFD